MTSALALPTDMADRARAFAAGRVAPVPARPASTVLLLRDDPGGIQVYTQRRHLKMAFAGGMVAFPGGGVDPIDALPDTVPDAAGWALRLGASEPAAREYVNAALRETREETGVRLEPGDLVPWAHWITPRFERRRFDTWFFVARLPDGQAPRDISGEASDVFWITPADAIGRADRRDWIILPPTRSVLTELCHFGSVSEVLGSERRIETIVPGWFDDGTDVLVLLPTDPRYPGDDPGDVPMIIEDRADDSRSDPR